MDFFDFLSNEYNIVLNEQQKAAVSHLNGPALVLAGPGSGKTTVITARTAFLCLEAGVNPRSILTMTFNRAATHEMRSRFDRMFGKVINQRVHFSTIHSFCYQVLHDYENRQGQKFRLIESESEEVRKDYILRALYQKINGTKANDEELEQLSSEIGLVKNRMIKIENIDSSARTKNLDAIFQAYESLKKENLYIDYDDMLSYAFLILRKCSDILDKYKSYYRYIQVDEGQDISKLQFEILNLMVDRQSQNLFIVADDDQSIYGFRGAAPEHILDIKDRYKDCRTFKLVTNYRSSKNIVEISSKFIKINKRRFDKNHNTLNGYAVDPYIKQVESGEEQLKYVLKKAADIQSDIPGSTVAVIYRNNLSSIPFVDVLERQNISFRIRQNKLHFFSSWVVQDIVALMRFSLDQMDAESFERVYYKIKRYISRSMIDYAGKIRYKESYINALLEFPNLQAFQIRNYKKLKEEFKKISALKPGEALDFIAEEFKYGEFASDYCEKARISFENVAEIYAVLRLISKNCDSIPEFLRRISELDEMVQGRELSARKANITLTTMHSSKGLEFDCVFMIDLTNDEIPGIDIKEEKNEALIEEERRLFYVGMTRARKYLYLIYPKFRAGFPQSQSAFLKEVVGCLHPQEVTENAQIRKGALIEHKMIGRGVVESLEKHGDRIFIKISFDGVIRTFDYMYCKENNVINILN